MNRILDILNKEFPNINQAAFILAFFAFLSQLLAIIRDRALAHFLGPSAALDTYYAAFRIPDLIFVSIASLAAVTALLPFLAEKMKPGLAPSQIDTGNPSINSGQAQISADKKKDEAREFFNQIFTVFLGVMILVSTIIFFLMPLLAPVIAPGFSPEMHEKLVMMSRIMLLSPILLGLSNLVGSVTQLFRKFFVFALTPVFYNIGILIGVLVLYPLIGLNGLAIGVIIGALLHLLIQLPVVARHHFIPRFSTTINFREIWKVISISIPRTLGLALHNLVFLAIVAFASLVSEGAISIFQFSYNLQAVPLTLVGVSYSVAAFPALARFFLENQLNKFVRDIAIAARQIIFWSLPIMFLFIVLRAHIVRVILGTGAFTWDDTRLTAAALALFSISIVAQSLILLFVRGFYAAGKTKRPLLINLFSTVLIIILAYGLLELFNQVSSVRYFFESLLRVENISGTGILMLPLAFSLGAIVNFFLLWRSFKREVGFVHRPALNLGRTFFQSLGASFFIGFVAYQFLQVFAKVFDLNTFWGIFLQGFLAGIIGIIAGIAILKLMKNKQLEEIQNTLRSKFWKVKGVVASGQKGL